MGFSPREKVKQYIDVIKQVMMKIMHDVHRSINYTSFQLMKHFHVVLSMYNIL